MKQSTALDILKTGQNVFLTGQAGAGKTYVLNQYIKYLRECRIATAITATTGLAATHMGGVTVHSWAKIGIHKDVETFNFKRLTDNEDFVEKIKNTKVLIVDEISMLHAKQVELIDQVLQKARENNEPFGGLQVIFSGDFYQLPPVGEKGETSKEKFAFMSPVWAASKFQICYLSEQHRQNDANADGLSLTNILNQIRSQTVSWEAVDALKATEQNSITTNRTRLYTHNVDVDKINNEELAKLTTTARTFAAIASGEQAMCEVLERGVRAPKELTLKIGAKVMFVKNIPTLGVFNGTMGVVKRFADKSGRLDEVGGYPIIELNDGKEVYAVPEEWSIEDERGGVLANYSQVPLCLAWAITVHKSQGMTLDAAEIDLSKTFEMGQGYVALSRLSSLSGLKLLGLNTKSLLLDEWVQQIDRRFIALSQEQGERFKSLDDETVKTIHHAFIKACNGVIPTKGNQSKAILQSKTKPSTADSTIDQTMKLVKEGLSIADIAKERSLAESTIIGHLATIKQQYADCDLTAYQPPADELDEIGQAYDLLESQGEFADGVKLRPLVDELREKYSYNQVRLALIFLNPTNDKADH